MPTKFTAARRERILEALRGGHYLKHAAALAGVGERTVHDWLERGRGAQSGAYRQFADDVEAADATAVEGHLEVIRDAKDPRVSLEFLGRRHPQMYAKVERQEVTGSGGEPLRVQLEWVSGPQAGQEQ